MASQGLFPEDLTLRSLLGGILVGTLLCCTNLYLGLQSAFITMASMQAALVGYGLLSCISRGKAHAGDSARRTQSDAAADDDDDDLETEGEDPGEGAPLRGRRGILAPFTAQENAVLQATAVSLGSMPLSAGLIGIVPAFSMLNPVKDGPKTEPFTFGWPALTLWCASMAYFGVFFASPMRTAMILKEKLRFPSGSATAQLIALLHGEKLRDDSVREKSNDCHSTGEEDVTRRSDRHESSTRRFRDEVRPLLRRNDTELEVEKEVEGGWSTLLKTFTASTAITLASFAVPVLYAIPAFDPIVPGHDAAAMWAWYVTPSLSYVGQGIIMGPETTISMFAGAVVGWAIISPAVHYAGWTNGIPTDAEAGSQAWMLWVALAIMTSESIIGLGMLAFRSRKSDSGEGAGRTSSQDFEPRARLVPKTWIVGGALVSGVVASVLLHLLFAGRDVPVWVSPVGIILAGLLSILAVRALGATDLNPVNALGKLSQLVLAVVSPGNITANMVGGALAEAGAMQAGELMQDYKTGHLLRASPRGQFFGQLVGSTAGIFVSATAYKLYERAYKLPGPDMPAPAARLWLNFARLINHGSLPPYSGVAMIVAGLLFAVTTLLKSLISSSSAEVSAQQQERRTSRFAWVKWLPNGVAFAVGLGLNTPNYSLARLVGGLIVLIWQRRERKRIAERRRRNSATAADPSPSAQQSTSGSNSLPPVTLLIWSAGFVLGEGFASIVLLFLKEAGLGPLTCWGCRGGCSGGC